MKQFEEALARDLTAIADEADVGMLAHISNEVERADRDARAAQRPRRRRHVGMAALAAGVVTAVISIAALDMAGVVGDHDRPTPQTSSAAPDFLSPIKPGEPCVNAHRLSLGDLVSASRVPMWMPNATQANSKALTGSWMCSGSPVLTFGPIRVSFERAGNLGDPKTAWTDLAKGLAGASVGTVLGRPAYVEPPMGDKGRGEVLVDVDGTLIRVMGDGHISTDALKAIANSIDLGRPLTNR